VSQKIPFIKSSSTREKSEEDMSVEGREPVEKQIDCLRKLKALKTFSSCETPKLL